MHFSELRAKLKRLNPKIVMRPGPWWGSAIYVYQPSNPDASENGLVQITSVPSPYHYHNIQKYDEHIPVEHRREGEPGFKRGWNTALKMLVTKGHIKRHDASLVFGVSF